MSSPRFLSKSKLMSGAQCARRLWQEVHAPERTEWSEEAQHRFAAGHEVGAAARSLWPGGFLIGHDRSADQALEETRQRLAGTAPVTLFEATLRADRVLVRTDILERRAGGELRLVEVKASTAMKPHYIRDCAIQAWVLEQSGLPPARVELAHVNSEFVYPGHGDYAGLLAIEDITADVAAGARDVPRLLAELRQVLDGAEPAIGIGPHCQKPYACPFIGHCSGPQPEFPVSGLPNGGRMIPQLASQGIRDIRDIPDGVLASETQEWVRRVTVSGQPDLRPGAAPALRALAWPRYYLDFETVSFAVPVWAGTRPYQTLSFQWSCHVEQADGALAHREFLAEGGEAPMRRCAETLIAALAERGPVLVYTAYEANVLEELAAMFPDLGSALRAIRGRLVDLHPLTKANYYHPAMRGSWSLKAVLPTIAPELSHEHLQLVRAGTEAEAAFRELLAGELPGDRRHALRQALLAYCRLDTLALVRLARFLEGRDPLRG